MTDALAIYALLVVLGYFVIGQQKQDTYAEERSWNQAVFVVLSVACGVTALLVVEILEAVI